MAASGAIGWLLSGVSNAALAASFSLTWFLVALSAWKLAWAMNRTITQAPVSWSVLVFPYVMLLTGLGVVWTGTMTGGALPGAPDSVSPSAFEAFFGPARAASEADFLLASWWHWGALGLAIATAYWTAARRSVLWERLHESFPKTAGFLASSYGFDSLLDQVLNAVRWIGTGLQKWVDQRGWGSVVPRAMGAAVRGLGSGGAWVDRVLSTRLDRTVRRGTEVPAKMLQVIQSGDVQWYLFFAIGSGIAMLVHFLHF